MAQARLRSVPRGDLSVPDRLRKRKFCSGLQDRPQPHNFAQGLGGVFLAIATVFLIPLPVVGLALALLVAVLAFVNFAFGYCMGCQIFFQLDRRGLIRA